MWKRTQSGPGRKAISPGNKGPYKTSLFRVSLPHPMGSDHERFYTWLSLTAKSRSDGTVPAALRACHPILSHNHPGHGPCRCPHLQDGCALEIETRSPLGPPAGSGRAGIQTEDSRMNHRTVHRKLTMSYTVATWT